MEESHSEKVQEWLQDQEKLTGNYFDTPSQKQKIKHLLEQIDSYDSMSLPQIREKGLFLFKQQQGEEHPSLIFLPKEGKEQLLVAIDPDTANSLAGFKADKKGTKVAYGISESGSDVQQWRIFDLEKKENLKERLKDLKFINPVWAHDGKSFFYTQERTLFQHLIGTAQAEDSIIWEHNEKEGRLRILSTAEEGRYLICGFRFPADRECHFFLFDLTSQKMEPIRLDIISTASDPYVGEVGGNLLFITEHEANNRQIIAVDLKNAPQKRVFIPEQPLPKISSLLSFMRLRL